MDTKKSAIISECGKYRYELRRVWDNSKPLVLFIGLNPSTADGTKDDPTSRVCINYAKRWGYGGVMMANLFAYRSTDKSVLRDVADPIGPDNDRHIARLIEEAGEVVCAWTDDGRYQGRDKEVFSTLKSPKCLTQLKSGSPGHPLYKRRDLVPVSFT